MTQVSIIEQVRKLVELQNIDKEIYDIRQDLSDMPSRIEKLQQAFEAKKAGLKELEEKSKGVKMTRDSFEVDLKVKEDAIAKANTDLSQIKTNKEYTAKISEIEGIKADKSKIEEQILHSYDDADAIIESVKKEKESLAGEEQKFNSDKKAIEDKVISLEEKVKTLKVQRDQIAPAIDPTTLSRYEKVLENKKGMAIVVVQGASCSGCFMQLPQQVINQIKMHEELVTCESCTRLLYLEEDL